MNGIPRPEHPRPRFFRKSWENLNGVWEYAFDFSLSGREKGWNARTSLDGTITVPFCPESARSGVGFTDFLPAVWLLRRFDVPAERLAGDVLLHFGAVDYEAEVFVNGAFAGRHTGGYTPFALDVTALLRAGENICRVCAGRRPQRPPAVGQAVGGAGVRGLLLDPHHRVWQTVWLEFVPKQRLSDWQASPTRAMASWISPPSSTGTRTAARCAFGRLWAASPPERRCCGSAARRCAARWRCSPCGCGA